MGCEGGGLALAEAEREPVSLGWGVETVRVKTCAAYGIGWSRDTSPRFGCCTATCGCCA
jgi:hypothetical protein